MVEIVPNIPLTVLPENHSINGAARNEAKDDHSHDERDGDGQVDQE